MSKTTLLLASKKQTKAAPAAGYGPHLTFDGYGCDPALLNDLRAVHDFLLAFPRQIGMQALTRPYVLAYDGGLVPTDYGVTGFVIIAESHISIHTYPHDGALFLDVFSCKPFDVEKAKKFIRQMFKVQGGEFHLVVRGKRFRR